VEVSPERWWSGTRDRLAGLVAHRRTAVLGVVAAVLVGAGLAGALRPSAAPAPPETAAATSSAPTAPPSAPPPAAESAAPDWASVVRDLYARRATAFETGTAAPLDEVYAPDSPLLAADRQDLEDLAAAGELLSGFAPDVVRATATVVTDDRVELDLVDRWPDYVVVARPTAAPVRTESGRPETPVRMVLVRTDDGWRIHSAVRTG
jgi:hypothetical protein